MRWPARCRLLCLALFLALLAAPALARTLIDEAGRTVTLPEHPHRILCLTPSIADTVFAIGAGDDVAGVTDYTLYPPEARRKPSIGAVLRPSLERITVLHPDLAIGISSFNDAESIRGLERLGVPVFLVNPVGLSGLYRSLGSIGRAIGRESDAAALALQLRQRERAVRESAAKAFGGRRPKVFLAISMDPCITAGRGAFLTDLLAAAGADSVTAALPQEWVHIDLESIFPQNPEFILVLHDASFGLKEMRERPGWRSMPAVQAGRILRIDERMQYPSPVAFEALEDFARQLRTAQRR